MQDNSSSEEIAVYPKRWLILVSLCTIATLTFFFSRSFTAANQIYADYYDVDLIVIDWSALAMDVGAVAITPLFAWIFFRQAAGFRIMSITAASCLLISTLVLLLSIQFPVLYPVMVLSSLLQGVSYTVGYTIGPSFAVLWFPDHQVGIAIASDLLSRNLGMLMGAILSPVVLKDYPKFGTNSTSENTHQIKETWMNNTHSTLLFLYIPCACILLILIVFFSVFMTDLPPKPPTYALLLKRIMNKNLKTEDKSFTHCLLAVKSLYMDVNFVLCNLVFGVGFNVIIVFILHVTVLVERFDVQSIGIDISNDIVGGILVGIYGFSNIIFGFVSAKISNKWKNYAGQILLGLVCTLFFLASMTLAFYYRSFYLFCCGLFFYSIGSRLFVVPLLEVITRHTYPMDETFVAVLVSATGSICRILLGELARIISLYAPRISLLILMCGCNFVAIVLAFLINPRDKRREADMKQNIQDNTESNETSPLLATELKSS